MVLEALVCNYVIKIDGDLKINTKNKQSCTYQNDKLPLDMPDRRSKANIDSQGVDMKQRWNRWYQKGSWKDASDW